MWDRVLYHSDMLFKTLPVKMASGALLVLLILLCSSSAGGVRLRGGSSKPAASLHGFVAGYRWAIELRHGKEAGVSPCVSVYLVKNVRGSVGTENSVCGGFSPYPLLVQDTEGSGRTSRAIVGMVFDAKFSKVRIVLRGRTARYVSLHLLDKVAAKRGNVGVLRYGAFAFAGATCVSQIVPYSESDREWQGSGFQGECDQ